jgi:hypothetical protein
MYGCLSRLFALSPHLSLVIEKEKERRIIMSKEKRRPRVVGYSREMSIPVIQLDLSQTEINGLHLMLAVFQSPLGETLAREFIKNIIRDFKPTKKYRHPATPQEIQDEATAAIEAIQRAGRKLKDIMGDNYNLERTEVHFNEDDEIVG